MLAPVYHVLPLATIIREGTMPVADKISAHVNQRVSPTDVIGEATFAREHVLLDVARTFGVSTQAADRMLKVNPGDRVTQGALVADAGGLIPRSIRAPRAGRVMIVGSGQILMEVGDARVELRAGLPGVVTQVIPERGVVIRTAGALIQGVWGNGRIDNGLMVRDALSLNHGSCAITLSAKLNSPFSRFEREIRAPSLDGILREDRTLLRCL